MGTVVALIRMMPGHVLSDEELETVIKHIKNRIKDPVKIGRVEPKNVAFGLRGIDLTITMPDKEGGVDPIAEDLKNIEHIDSVEVVDVGLL